VAFTPAAQWVDGVALFDPKDALHGRCVTILKGIREPIASERDIASFRFALGREAG
jgi:hypothetical protein